MNCSTPAPISRSTHALDLLLRQRQLQPFAATDADLRALSATCRALRPYHPGQACDEPYGSSIESLANQIGGTVKSRREVVAKLQAAGRCEPLYLQSALEDCRDTIWASDAWGRGVDHHPDRAKLNPERLRAMAGIILSLRMDIDMKSALRIAASHADSDLSLKIFSVAADVRGVVQHGSPGYIAVKTTYDIASYTGTCMLAAQKAHKFGQVIAIGAVGGIGSMIGALGSLSIAAASVRDYHSRDESRREAFYSVEDRTLLMLQQCLGRGLRA